MKNKNTIKHIVTGALTIALVCISTAVIQIQIPLGYMHFGNIFILLFAYLFPWDIAMAAAGIGSAFADLFTGFPQWILPTLIIKSFMGFAASRLYHPKGRTSSLRSFSSVLASLVGIVIMIAGYTLAGIIMYGNFYTGIAQIPGLSAEGIFGIVGFYLIAFVLEKSHARKIIRIE